MKQRALLFLSFVIISSPAYGHGIEIIMTFIMATGIVFGLIGGITSGLLKKTKVLGLVVSIVIYFVIGLGFLAYDTYTGAPIPNVEPTPFLESAYSVVKLQLYGGVIPLIISFLLVNFIYHFIKMRNNEKA